MALSSSFADTRPKGMTAPCQLLIYGGRFRKTNAKTDDWRGNTRLGAYYGWGCGYDARRLGSAYSVGEPMGPYLRSKRLRLTMGLLGPLRRRLVYRNWPRKLDYRGLPLAS